MTRPLEPADAAAAVVEHALVSRRSIRAFRPDPVDLTLGRGLI
jgi:nitroreductase